MYVVCHKCAAAYLVEDGLIVQGDERAQCPNCMHVQALVEPKVEVRPPTLFRRPLSPAAKKAAAPAFRIPSIPPVAPTPPLGLNGDDGVAEAPGQATCRQCAARLIDEFDQALGICERCRTHAKRDPTPAPQARQSIDDEKTVSYSAQGLEPSDLEEGVATEPLEDADDIAA